MAFDVGPAHPYIVRSSLVKVPKASEFSSSPAFSFPAVPFHVRSRRAFSSPSTFEQVAVAVFARAKAGIFAPVLRRMKLLDRRKRDFSKAVLKAYSNYFSCSQSCLWECPYDRM